MPRASKALPEQQDGTLARSAASVKAKMEQSWEAVCLLSCPSIHGTRAEQSLPKERVTSFLSTVVSCCHNLDVLKLMAVCVCVFKQLLVQPFSTVHFWGYVVRESANKVSLSKCTVPASRTLLWFPML